MAANLINISSPSPQVQVKRTAEEYAAKVGMPPKTHEENLAFRQKVLDYGGNYAPWARAFVLKGRSDPVWWIDTWGRTQNPKDFPDSPDQPIITWPKQEQYIRWLVERIGKRPCAMGKSREQGATVITCNVIAWLWESRPLFTALMVSRVASMVDGGGFADSTMPKMDYTIDAKPDWARAPGYEHDKPHRKLFLMKNPDNGAMVRATTTNKWAGVGSRFSIVWGDEVSKIDKFKTVHTAIANVTNCPLYTSTPTGWDLFAQIMHAKEFDKFELHWTDNPLWWPRGHGESECDWKASRRWPEKWLCKRGSCRLLKLHPLGGMPHSERFDMECEKFGWDDRTVAQELEIAYHQSGGGVFPGASVAAALQLLTGLNIPFKYVSLDWVLPQGALMPEMSFEQSDWYVASREWKVKAKLDADGYIRVYKFPDPTRLYVMGADCARGMAHSDADVAVICDVVAGEIVAEIHGKYGPKRFAPMLGQFCRWYGMDSGCVMDAYACPEWNADGKVVAEDLFAMGVPVHVSRQSEGTRRGKGTRHFGVVIGPTIKARLINSCLVPALEPHPETQLPWGLVDPFAEAYSEYQTFITHDPAPTRGLNADNIKVGGMSGCPDDRVMARAVMAVGAMARYGTLKGVDPRDWCEKPEEFLADVLSRSGAAARDRALSEFLKVLRQARIEETARRTALGLPPASWMVNEAEMTSERKGLSA